MATRCPIKARLIRIGNSRGVRLPKPAIEEAGLKKHVQLQVRGGTVVISSSVTPRAGWAQAARRMRELGEGGLLDKPTSTRFDAEEWHWR